MYVKVNLYRDIYEKKDALMAMKDLYKKYFYMDVVVKDYINKEIRGVFKNTENQPVMGCIY